MKKLPTRPSEFHVRWPCERFYWSLLDTSRLPTGEKVSHERLRFLVEPELPVPLEEVHAVFVRLGEVRTLACALPQDVVRDQVPPSTLTLGPSDVPPFVREIVGPDFDPSRLNLLVEEFEPACIRSWRRRSSIAAFAGLSFAFALVVFGLERRITRTLDGAEELRARRDELVSKALGPAPVGQPLPPELRLAAELRSLRQTRHQSEKVAGPVNAVDATDRLVDLLRTWPADVETRTESIVVSDGAVHVHGVVAESEQAQRLATATSSLAGLQMSFPSIQSGPEGCRFGLEWSTNTGAKR